MDYYVYSHASLDGEVFYIGKGKGRRAWSKAGRSKAWHGAASGGFVVQIVAGGLSEADAFDVERKQIAVNRQSLCNKTSGGQGISGYRHTEASKARIASNNSIAQTGKRRSEAHRKAIGDGSRGVPKSPQMIERLRAAKNTPEAKEKARQTGIRNGEDPDVRKRKSESLSVAMRGREFAPSHRLAISRAQGGMPVMCIETSTRFETATDAANWIKSGGNPRAWGGNITAACKGKLKSAYGLRWQFAE